MESFIQVYGSVALALSRFGPARPAAVVVVMTRSGRMADRSNRSIGEPSFERVLRDALDGHSAAYDRLFRTYAGRIRAFAIARGTSDPDAITNDVMLRAFRNLGSFDGSERAFVGWIFTIARNRVIDAHRSSARGLVLVDVEVPDRAEASAESVAVGQLGVEDIARKLQALTDEQQEVLVLRLVHDLSLNEVADIVGRPVTAVKALQRRGLRALRKQFDDEVVS